MRSDMKTILLAMFATACFNVGCDDDDDTGGAGGAGGVDMGMNGGEGGDGAGGMGGGAGGAMGGAGGGVEATCESECQRLGDCAAASDTCPGLDADSLPGPDGFVAGCIATCEGMMSLLALTQSQSECEPLIGTLQNVSPDFAAACAGGGEGGMGGEGGEGGMGGEGGSHFPEGDQIDRMGRAAVSTALIGAEDKDGYNQDSDPAGWVDNWGAKLTAGLQFVDSLDNAPDGAEGNPPLIDPAALGPFLATDVLRVDTSKEFSDGGYLHVELVAVGILEAEAASSGGRSLSQDVMDLTLSALVGGALDTNWDCVPANDVPFKEGFPYLADPHMGTEE